MKYRIACQQIFATLAILVAVSGSAYALQDENEIPATASAIQDNEPADPATPEPQVDDNENPPPIQDFEYGNAELAEQIRKEKEEFKKQSIEIPETWKRLGKNHIWADAKNRRVIARGAVCLNEGLLEMFACPRQTKEHEAVISMHALASEVHATLLAIGVEPGKPMVWDEKHYPASGPVMDIEIWWTDENGKIAKRRAQEMILNTDTGKAMDSEFVFAGSEKIFDPYEKKNVYLADFGPMINVANQPDAMIDVSTVSSAAAQGSLFRAFTKNIPPVNTKVYVVLSASGKVIEPVEREPKKEEKMEATPEKPADDAGSETK